MTNAQTKIEPTCKYNHGKLLLVSDQEKQRKWTLSSYSLNDPLIFIGDLYVCPTCGYTEFFDDEPQTTFNEYKPK